MSSDAVSDDESEGEEMLGGSSLLGAPGRRSWDESYQALVEYQKIYGNCLVPSAFEVDSALGHWVRKQRRNEGSGTLPPSKRALLEKLGFVFKLRTDQYVGQKSNPRPVPIGRPAQRQYIRKRTWADNYDALVSFVNENGHCNLPKRYPPDLTLGRWVCKQRSQQDKLTKRQRQMLEDIGFNFRKEKYQRVWDEKLEELKAYEAKHGDYNVPYDDGHLGLWVADQRKAYAEGRLSSDRTAALEDIGFSLEQENEDPEESEYEEGAPVNTVATARTKITLAERWESQYDKLVRFHQSHGHCIVPRTDKTLNYWVQRNRQLNLQNKLKQDRKEMLDELNFEWYFGINTLPEHYFDEMIQRLSDFQQLEGHVDVPRTYLRGGLGEWLDEIKSQGRDGLLEPMQADRLLPIGFSWFEKRESWHENLEDASLEINNCRGRTDGLSLPLAVENWLKVQYMLLDYDLLPLKRQHKLESLGLGWDGETLSWGEAGVIHDGKNELVFDDEISTGFDLKDAAISWTPDRKAAGRAATMVEEQRTESKDVSPMVDVELDAKAGTPTRVKEDDVALGACNKAVKEIPNDAHDLAAANGTEEAEGASSPDPMDDKSSRDDIKAASAAEAAAAPSAPAEKANTLADEEPPVEEPIGPNQGPHMEDPTKDKSESTEPIDKSTEGNAPGEPAQKKLKVAEPEAKGVA